MAIAHQLTVAEFDELTRLPEYADQLFEFIGGGIVEVPSNPYSSQIAGLISAALLNFLQGKNLGHVTGEAGGYMVSGERYAPDVAFISKTKQPQLPREGYNPLPPDFAVEVISPSDSERNIRIKLANYLAAGTLVWLVYLSDKAVEVYYPQQPVRILDVDGVLDGGRVLPDFTLAVRDIFPQE